MFSIVQFLRNSYIRLEGLLYQLFSFVRNLFVQIFSFLAKLFGFSKIGYFLESDEATSLKSNQKQQEIATQPKVTPEVPVTSRRRRPDPNMDYFRKMAQEVNKS